MFRGRMFRGDWLLRLLITFSTFNFSKIHPIFLSQIKVKVTSSRYTLPSFFLIYCFNSSIWRLTLCVSIFITRTRVLFFIPGKGYRQGLAISPPTLLSLWKHQYPAILLIIAVVFTDFRTKAYHLRAFQRYHLLYPQQWPLISNLFKQIGMKGLHFTHICCGLSFVFEYRSKPSYRKAWILQVKTAVFRKGNLT